MSQFTDKAGREWRLAIDAPSIMAVRKDYDADFMRGDPPTDTFDRLSEDPVVLCGAAYVLCRKQIAERQLTQEQFYLEVLADGETIQKATAAVKDAILDFTQPRSRELLSVTAAKNAKFRELAISQTMERLAHPDLDERAKQMISGKLDDLFATLTLPTSATSEPASAASLPTA